MRRQAVVTAIHADVVEVIALLSDVCILCNSADECGKRGKPFFVVNKHSLPLEVGSVVKVYHSPFVRGVSGLVALFIPLICAFAAYLCAPALALKTGIALTEAFKACCVLIGFFVPCIAIFVINRSNLHLFKPIITQVL